MHAKFLKIKVCVFLTHVNQLETEIMYLGKLISSINRAHDCWNGILNNPLCLVILSVFGSIKCNETKWQKPQFQLQVWLQMRFELATYIFCYNAQNTLCAAHLPQTTQHTMFWSVNICALYLGALICGIFHFLGNCLGVHLTYRSASQFRNDGSLVWLWQNPLCWSFLTCCQSEIFQTWQYGSLYWTSLIYHFLPVSLTFFKVALTSKSSN